MQYMEILTCQFMGDRNASYRPQRSSLVNGSDEYAFRRLVDPEDIGRTRNTKEPLDILSLGRNGNTRLYVGGRRLGLCEKVGPFATNCLQFDVKINREPLVPKETGTEQWLGKRLVVCQAQFTIDSPLEPITSSSSVLIDVEPLLKVAVVHQFLSSQETRANPYAVTSTGASGFLNLHSPFGHCATAPAFSHFSIK
jgi:hypothetical protein